METNTKHPKFQPILRYLGAYSGLFFFGSVGLAISWCLRSDIFSLCVAFSAPEKITNFLYTYTIPLVVLIWVLASVGLEHYFNQAARSGGVLRQTLKVLAIEGGIGLVILLVMGGLALAGYPPIW